MPTGKVFVAFALLFLTATVLLDPCSPTPELAPRPQASEVTSTQAVLPPPPLVPSTPMEAALDELRRRFPNQFVIGFEELFDPRPESEPHIDLGPADTTFAAALERVRRVAPQYRIDLLKGNLVHVYPAKTTADPIHLLDVRLAEFHMPQDSCLQTAIGGIDRIFDSYAPELAQLLFDRRAAWNRAHGQMVTGYAGDVLGNCVRSAAPGPAYSNITVREALNLLALRSLKVSRGEAEPVGQIHRKIEPISWKFRFRREPDADTGLGRVPLFQIF
ncbi:MAG TPA: hypothetical protein VKF84_13335 [Candidatus Sulfotelmatobacter sp.]|nr:hypothetical protein [Candidatus Sulfotelmatobacter sp.]